MHCTLNNYRFPEPSLIHQGFLIRNEAIIEILNHLLFVVFVILSLDYKWALTANIWENTRELIRMDNLSEKCQTSAVLTHLPSEILISILKYLNSKEIESTILSCRSLYNLVRANSIWLARQRHKATVDSANNIHIKNTEGDGRSAKRFQLAREDQNDQRLEGCLRTVQLTTLTIHGPVDESEIDYLVRLLYRTRQFQIHLFEMQSVTIESDEVCGRLFQLLASGNYHAITFEDCKLACGFTKEQSTQLEDLCQFTVKNCKPSNGLGILGKYLSKLAYDMRFKPRISLPFYAEAPNLKVSELCQFIKTWIAIYEAPSFQIYVNNHEPGFKTEFLQECSKNGLIHHRLEFKSRAHPMAYIKAVFDDNRRRFQMFPIIDVPPRIDRGFCTARQFRDF